MLNFLKIEKITGTKMKRKFPTVTLGNMFLNFPYSKMVRYQILYLSPIFNKNKWSLSNIQESIMVATQKYFTGF